MFSQKTRCDKALDLKRQLLNSFTVALYTKYNMNTSLLRWTVIIYAKPNLYAYIRDTFNGKPSWALSSYHLSGLTTLYYYSQYNKPTSCTAIAYWE